MPQSLISPLTLAEAVNKDSSDALLRQIKETHVEYFSSSKPAKAVGFLCMLFDQCMEWVGQHGQSTFIKHPVEKLLKKVVEQIMVAVPDYYSSVLDDAAYNGAKSLAGQYQAEMANFLSVNTDGPRNNKSKDGFHTMVAYRGSSTHSQTQDIVGATDRNKKLTFHDVKKKETALLQSGELQSPVFTDPYAEGRMKILKKLGLESSQILSNDMLMSRLVNDQTNQAKVVYMRKHERLKYLLDLGPMIKRRTEPSGVYVPLTAHLWLYAATDQGELYAVDDKALVQSGRTSGVELNHSSILKGRPVLCAGTISAQNGAITTIDNASGHYAPSWQRVRKVLEMLRRKNALDRNAEVFFLDRGQNSILFIYRWNAWEFLSGGFYALPRNSGPNSPALTYQIYIDDIQRGNLASYMEVNIDQMKRNLEKQSNKATRILRF